jgi:GxxExxY protein
MNHEGTQTQSGAQREVIPVETEEVASTIVDAAFTVHLTLGPGLLESVYEQCLAYELTERGLQFQRQIVLPIEYKRLRIDGGLRLDMVVEDRVIVELKAVDKLAPVHMAQILTYMRLTGLRLGFLVNFNVSLIKDGIHRVVL